MALTSTLQRLCLAATLALAVSVGASPTPAHAALQCGETVLEDTTLDADIVGCGGDGLVIAADGVDLDLNGHTIDGVGLGTAVRNDGYDSVTITNGTITQFDYGVQLNQGTRENLVRGLTLRENQNMALRLANADKNEIRDNEIAQSLIDGIVVNGGSSGNHLVGNHVVDTGGDAVRISASPSTTLESTDVTTSKDRGLVFKRSRAVTLADSTIAGTSDAGVVVAGSPSSTLTGNQIRQTGDAGVSLTSSDGGTVTNNRFTNTGDAGVLLDKSDDALMRRNVFSTVGDAGFTVMNSHGNRILANSVTGASDSGVYLQSAIGNRIVRNDLRSNPSGVELDGSNLNRIVDNDASGSGGSGITLENSGQNEVLTNLANNNGASGIYLKGESATHPIRNVVRGNTAHDNKATGIFVENPKTTVTDNLAYRNSSWGMYAMLGVRDGGGNQAHGNGEPLQCLNISCTDP